MQSQKEYFDKINSYNLMTQIRDLTVCNNNIVYGLCVFRCLMVTVLGGNFYFVIMRMSLYNENSCVIK